MTEADLDDVVEIAAEGFPDHFEDRPCFANRLTLWPQGALALEDGEGVAGYVFAYPWRMGAAPALNVLLDALPPDADVLYLHDMALGARARGTGQGHAVIARLDALAREVGLPAMALVAVNDAAGYWSRFGFGVRTPSGMAEKLASYGPDARYMIRMVPNTT